MAEPEVVHRRVLPQKPLDDQAQRGTPAPDAPGPRPVAVHSAVAVPVAAPAVLGLLESLPLSIEDPVHVVLEGVDRFLEAPELGEKLHGPRWHVSLHYLFNSNPVLARRTSNPEGGSSGWTMTVSLTKSYEAFPMQNVRS